MGRRAVRTSAAVAVRSMAVMVDRVDRTGLSLGGDRAGHGFRTPAIDAPRTAWEVATTPARATSFMSVCPVSIMSLPFAAPPWALAKAYMSRQPPLDNPRPTAR
jgi:hypothetical protein